MKIRLSLIIKALPIWVALGWCQALAQVSVTVNAGTTVVTIPSQIYGNNAQFYNAHNNGTDTTYNTAMQISGCRNIRWPGGSEADQTNWNNVVCWDTGAATTPQFITFLQAFGGTLQPIVNGSGIWCNGAAGSAAPTTFTYAAAVSLAEAWVTWNESNTGSAKAMYWEVGNELYGDWEVGGQGAAGVTMNGTVYGENFADFYTGMKAIDSTIQIGAVASPGSTDYDDWTPDMLTAAKAAGVVPDFLIIHNYPVSADAPAGQATDSYILSFPSTVATQTTNLNNIISSTLGSSYVGQVKYFMTEYNCCLGPDAQVNEYVNAMFCSEWVLETAQNGWMGANLWATENGGTPDYGFLNTTTDVPFPNYYVYPMLTGKFGTNMVTCTSSNATTVSAFAALDASNDLTLFAVNNNPTASQSVTFNISGFTPASSGNAWVMLPVGTGSSGVSQEATTLSINGNDNPAPSAVTAIAGTSQATSSSFTVTLQPSEMYLLVIPTSATSATATPTLTPSATPSTTPTKTATATPTPTASFTPSRTPTPTATSTSTASATSTATSSMTATPSLTASKTASFTPSATPSGTPTSSPTATQTATLTQTPTATPSSTFSSTPTNTATRTVTPTDTYTATGTPTATPTHTLANTGTPTDTATLTVTASATSTATLTATSSPTASTTATPSSSMTSTPSLTVTATASSTSSPSPSRTPTASATPTASTTPTPTDSMTPTASLTLTPTTTLSPTSTVSSTPTNTLVNTGTPTSTATHSATSTATQTTTSTATISPTSTASNSPTGTTTSTATGSATPTASSTPSSTPTNTLINTGTPTSTPTLTVTLTPTDSATPTGTYTTSRTNTPTATPSNTATATLTASSTASSSPTFTSSSTPTFTPTDTSVHTPTDTASPTMSLTPTATLTESATPTFTPFNTLTATPSSTPTGLSTFTPTPSSSPTSLPPTKGPGGVVVYPNPVTGSNANVLPPTYSGTADVRAEIFTIAFRKVLDETFSNLPAGTAVTLTLDDQWGHPLANGLYYVVITVNGKHSVAKLLVLR